MNNNESKPDIMYTDEIPGIGIEKTIKLIDQNELEEWFKGYFYGVLSPEVPARELIEHLRWCLVDDEPQEEVHIVFKALPRIDEMDFFLNCKFNKKRALENEIMEFDEAKGMLELQRFQEEWYAKHANEPQTTEETE